MVMNMKKGHYVLLCNSEGHYDDGMRADLMLRYGVCKRGKARAAPLCHAAGDATAGEGTLGELTLWPSTPSADRKRLLARPRAVALHRSRRLTHAGSG